MRLVGREGHERGCPAPTHNRPRVQGNSSAVGGPERREAQNPDGLPNPEHRARSSHHIAPSDERRCGLCLPGRVGACRGQGHLHVFLEPEHRVLTCRRSPWASWRGDSEHWSPEASLGAEHCGRVEEGFLDNGAWSPHPPFHGTSPSSSSSLGEAVTPPLGTLLTPACRSTPAEEGAADFKPTTLDVSGVSGTGFGARPFLPLPQEPAWW